MIGQLAVFYGNCLPVKIRPQLCADCVHFPHLTSPATNAGYIRQIQILGFLGIIKWGTAFLHLVENADFQQEEAFLIGFH